MANKANQLHRRRFLKTAVSASAVVMAPTIIPSSALGRDGAVAPSERITVGGIGIGRRGQYDLGCLSGPTFGIGFGIVIEIGDGFLHGSFVITRGCNQRENRVDRRPGVWIPVETKETAACILLRLQPGNCRRDGQRLTIRCSSRSSNGRRLRKRPRHAPSSERRTASWRVMDWSVRRSGGSS